MRAQIKKADFIASFSNVNDCPKSELPELAIIGRSNVGKSTFINRILGKHNLARASSTPGRTQSLVYFKVELGLPRNKSLLLNLVDLPGYGFAKVPQHQRDRLHKLIVDYIEKRPAINAICLLNDCRRLPEEEELAVRDLVAECGQHLLVVVNKLDKLSRSEQTKALGKIASAYGLEPHDLIPSGLKFPSEDFWLRALSLLSDG